MLPKALAEHFDRGAVPPRGWYAHDIECDGSKFHSPKPLVVEDTDAVPWTDSLFDSVVLCGTCAANLGVYQRLLDEHDGAVPWVLRREFGNRIRAIGDGGWKLYQDWRADHA